MGQYFKIVFLNDDGSIRCAINPHTFFMGAKLCEVSHVMVRIALSFLLPDGRAHKCRVVWAGDYAEPEPATGETLYAQAREHELSEDLNVSATLASHTVLVNHDKRSFLNMAKYAPLAPLPLLVAEGNGNGGGDYTPSGREETPVGCWARDHLSVELAAPADFQEFEPKFFGELAMRMFAFMGAKP